MVMGVPVAMTVIVAMGMPVAVAMSMPMIVPMIVGVPLVLSGRVLIQVAAHVPEVECFRGKVNSSVISLRCRASRFSALPSPHVC